MVDSMDIYLQTFECIASPEETCPSVLERSMTMIKLSFAKLALEMVVTGVAPTIRR